MPDNELTNLGDSRGDNTGQRVMTAVHKELAASSESLVKRIQFWLGLAVGLVALGAGCAWAAAAYFGRFATAAESARVSNDVTALNVKHDIIAAKVEVLEAVVKIGVDRAERIENQVYEIAVRMGAPVVTNPSKK